MNVNHAGIVIALFTALLAGCTVSNELYMPERAPLAIEINATVELARPHHEQPLRVRTVYPAAGGPYPAIVLSHGTFSSFERYDRVAKHWAENGYVVLLPQHIDANYGITPKSEADMVSIVGTRVADMSLIIDELDAIRAQVPALADKIDTTRIVSAGHSIGTLVSMRVTGLVINDINTQQVISNAEERFVALVMLSDPGKMRQMPITAWLGSTVPTFMSTGTEDYGLMGSRDEPVEGNEILSNDLSVDRYQLLLQEGDHYFGGLVQKDVEKNPDYEGLDIFNKTSTAFLDAYVKGDRRAERYLREVDLSIATRGRAELIPELARN